MKTKEIGIVAIPLVFGMLLCHFGHLSAQQIDMKVEVTNDGFVKLIDPSSAISQISSLPENSRIMSAGAVSLDSGQADANFWEQVGFTPWLPTEQDFLDAVERIEYSWDRPETENVFVYVVNKDNPDANKIMLYAWLNFQFSKKSNEADLLILAVDNTTTPNQLRSWLGGLFRFGAATVGKLVGAMLLGNDIPYQEAYLSKPDLKPVILDGYPEGFQNYLPAYFMDFDEIPMFAPGEQVPAPGFWFAALADGGTGLFLGALNEIELPVGVVYGNTSEIKHHLLTKSFPTYSAQGSVPIARYGFGWFGDPLAMVQEYDLDQSLLKTLFLSNRHLLDADVDGVAVNKDVFTDLTHNGGIYSHKLGHGAADGFMVSTARNEIVTAQEDIGIYSPDTLIVFQESCSTGSFAPHLTLNHKDKTNLRYFLRDRTLSDKNSTVTSIGFTLPINASNVWTINHGILENPAIWFGKAPHTESLFMLTGNMTAKIAWCRIPASIVIHGDPSVSATDLMPADPGLQIRIGDVNGDLNVDETDLMLLLNYVGYVGASKINVVAGDVNRDGEIDIADVTDLLYFVYRDQL